MNIFFDLDGTLIDAKKRLYNLFKLLVKECDLSFDAYWQLKRQQKDHRYILRHYYKYQEEQIDAFTTLWMKEIELEKWLLLDKPFNNITEYLKDISTIADLYLITARQRPEMVTMQIEHFKWLNIFKDILVTKQHGEKDILIASCVKVDKNDFIVGDTGKDIQAGKALGIKTIGVLSGFRNKDILLKYNPDFIIENITDFNFRTYLPIKKTQL